MIQPAQHTTRRDMLQMSAGSALGLNLLGYMQARGEARALPAAALGGLKPLRSCIVVFYYGGPSQLETWDLKPDAPAEIRGEFKPIATTVPDIRISEHLPLMARHMHHVALIRSMTHVNRLHDSASMETFTGRKPPQGDQELFSPVPQEFPSWGGVINYMLRKRGLPVGHALLPFGFHNVVDVPCQGAGFLGTAFDPFKIEVDAEARAYRADALAGSHATGASAQTRRALLDALDAWSESNAGQRMRAHFDKAYQLLDSVAIRRALNLELEDPRSRDRYGYDVGPLPQGKGEGGGGGNGAELGVSRQMRGQNLLLARRLVEAGVPFVHVNDYRQQGQNWDAHFKCFNQHARFLLPVADRALSALIDDLDARGLLETTLIVGLGEFGRTPRINNDAGRDHWPDCYSVVLAGGGVRSGYVYGSSDRFAAYPASDPVTPADLAATIFWRHGLDPASEIRDTQGRPYPLALGKPVTSLFM